MKIEIHKGIVIYHDPKKNEYYTEVVIRKKNKSGTQYTASKFLERIRMDIDRFLAIVAKKKSYPKVWVKGAYEDSRYHLSEIIFQDKAAKLLTVRSKGRKITTIALSDFKFDAPKVFANTASNRKTIELMEEHQKNIEHYRGQRRERKLTLTAFESKSLR